MLVGLLGREDNYDFDEKILITIIMMMMLVRLLGTAEHRGGNRPSARLLGKADYCPDSRPWWSTIFFWGLMWCYNCLTKPTLLHKGSQKWMNFWNNSGRTSTPPAFVLGNYGAKCFGLEMTPPPFEHWTVPHHLSSKNCCKENTSSRQGEDKHLGRWWSLCCVGLFLPILIMMVTMTMMYSWKVKVEDLHRWLTTPHISLTQLWPDVKSDQMMITSTVSEFFDTGTMHNA